MAIEHALVQVVRKPWGVNDLSPWSPVDGSSDAVGELLFQRADKNAPAPGLLLKLLFTSEPLSIQVHPDDAFAHSIGLPNGKTEAWYILSATQDAKVAVGLKRNLTQEELRASIRDGSIADLVDWCSAMTGDVIVVPAGTIHAIGAGIVLAEIQQRSDTTFRLFDYGRQRELHADSAVAASDAGPLQARSPPQRLSAVRTILAAIPHFVIERIDLPADSKWVLDANRETWILVIEGQARIGLISASVGDAVFAKGDRAGIEAGVDGMSALVAYPGPDPIMPLLQESAEQMTPSADTPALREPKPKQTVGAQT
jgi:mannose-6-phosphate isomerase